MSNVRLKLIRQKTKFIRPFLLVCLIGSTILLIWWQFNTVVLASIWLILGFLLVASMPNVPSSKYVRRGIRILTRVLFYLAIFVLWGALVSVRFNNDINLIKNKLSTAVASISLPSSINLQTKFFTHTDGDIDQIEESDYYFNYLSTVNYNQAQQEVLTSLKNSGYKIVTSEAYNAATQKDYLDYLGGVKGRIVLYVNGVSGNNNIIQIDAEWNYDNQDPSQGPFD